MEKFATLVYAILDTKTHQFHYAKAGHTPPLYISGDGTLIKLETGGTILGFFEDASYKEESLNIAPGDLVVMYSDGITEAENPDGDQFEEERLEEVLLENRERSAAELIPEITSAVQQFTGREFQRDDMTLLVMRRTE